MGNVLFQSYALVFLKLVVGKMEQEAKKQIISNIYFNPEIGGSFSSPIKLYKAIKEMGYNNIELSDIKLFLSGLDVYTLHKTVKYANKKLSKVIAPYIKYQADIDLADMSYYEKLNNGFKYFLLVIDIFSRFVYTAPLKSKSGMEVSNAIKAIFEKGYIMEICRSDGGSEFSNVFVKKLLREYNVKQVITRNVSKASVAERAIQNIKSRLFRYMEYNNTHEWVNILEKITLGYNRTHHRVIGMAPINVTRDQEGAIWKRVYLPTLQKKKKIKTQAKHRKPSKIFKLKIGDHVRISFIREPFKRYYDENWSREIYTVKTRSYKRGNNEYTLNDYNNDTVKGVFYENELQKISEEEDREYIVETVIKTRGYGRNKQSFVKWLGWPKKFNSWIPTRELKSIRKYE